MRAIKYLLIVTVILFAAVFLITRFGKTDEIDDTDTAESTQASETVTSIEFNEEDNVNIDNIWAMFLVNNSNPLPDNYDSMITTEVVFEDYREYYMDSRMAEYFTNMVEDAKKDNIDLLMVSAYRTIAYQQKNFEDSVQERMDSGMDYDTAYVDASASVASPGKSEHNAGLAADIMCAANTNMDDDSFENTPEFEWLSEHAHEYGFILRYPKGKIAYTGIIYEPWHYRFVGVYYANELKKLDMCLEEYYEYRGWVDDSGKAIYMTGPVEKEEIRTPEMYVDAETVPPETEKVTTHKETEPEQSVTIIV